MEKTGRCFTVSVLIKRYSLTDEVWVLNVEKLRRYLCYITVVFIQCPLSVQDQNKKEFSFVWKRNVLVRFSFLNNCNCSCSCIVCGRTPFFFFFRHATHCNLQFYP